MLRRVTVGWFLGVAMLATAANANAQSGASGTSAGQSSSTTQTSPSSTAPAETRPATTTFFGDTGLWYVPTGEVLANGKWSVSGYRRGTNYIQGYSNVADFAGTFAFGVKDRAEIFGSFLVDTRIDRDVRPIFLNDANPAQFGGIIDRYPRVNQYWTGDNVGDFYIGAKVNFMSERENDPAAVALRGLIKLPTADKDNGVGTGSTDFAIDAIVSKEVAKRVEVSGFGGYEWRGSPDGLDIPGGAFRWGGGVGFPSRNFIRVTGELNGFIPSSDTATITAAAPKGIDNTTPPTVSATENLTRATFGLTIQSKKGVFFGAGVSWNVPTKSRNLTFAEGGDDVVGDYYDWQFRIGYHPGVRVYVPPPAPPPPAPPAAPAAPANRPPTVRAECNPCTVEVGKTSTVTATGQDPDGDTLTYRWTTPTGTLANPAEQSTVWTAPNTEGTVPVTVTVSDGKGGTASATVNIQVVRPAVRSYTFEDVHFDFDRYSLRPEATRVLDEAVNAMRQDNTLRLTIEGHTCNIGTAEYNLALGNRRAVSVRDYLTSRGVSADRLNTVSYGEERPKYDNAREETRRLNRRAALTVRLQ
jgi:outer membrane protein OmpA-like peptidoglycan-associated protein